MRWVSVVAVVAAVAVAGQAGAAPTAESSASVVVSPRHDAVYFKSPIRVVLARRAGTRTRVSLGRRDVTKRFHRKGRRLVGRLGRRDFLRYGRNNLTVLTTRAGRTEVSDARSFFVVRRRHFVRLNVRRGPPARAAIAIVSGGRSDVLRRRARKVTIRLNGRSVTRLARHTRANRRSISLSATHGLRYGINRLTVRVTEARSGRYELMERRFRIRRTRPLPAAGLDFGTRPGEPVRLGARARAARGGELRYRWRIVRRPKGSRARLRGATRARPSIRTDRIGRYVIEQRVAEYKRGRRVGKASVERMYLDSQPPPLMSVSADTNGIYLGSGQKVYFPHPTGAGAGTIQTLMVDRSNLTTSGSTPAGFNTICCYAGQLAPLLAKLTAAHLDQLVIIEIPPNQKSLDPSRYDDFNKALGKIGVDPLSAADLAPGPYQTVIVGIPGGQPGSGWVVRYNDQIAQFPAMGYLMASGAADTSTGKQRMRFQPLALSFNTSQTATSSRNIMSFGRPARATDEPPVTVDSNDTSDSYIFSNGVRGFHVVELDPRDLSVVNNEVYESNGDPSGAQFSVQAMADFIDTVRGRGNYVAVQSVGRGVGPDSGNNGAWADLTLSLSRMGANPDLLNRLQSTTSSYAFFGGPPLARAEVVESTGSLAGQARMRPDGYFGPRVSNGATRSSLFAALMRAPTPFPFEPGGGPANTDYAKAAAAIKYISNCLPELSRWDDIRLAYFGQPDADWDLASTNMGHIYYPGKAPSSDPGALPCKFDSPVPFDEPLFDAVHKQVTTEFGMISSLETMIGIIQKGFTSSKDKQLPFLSQLGTSIKNQVQAPNEGLVTPILAVLAALGDLAEESIPGVGPLIDLAAEAYDLGTAAVSQAQDDGTDPLPAGQRISTTVDNLAGDLQTRFGNASDLLDQILRVGVSDWGSMQALNGIYTSTPGLNQTELSDNLTTGAKAYFSTTLLPVAFDLFALKPAAGPGRGHQPEPNPTPDNCYSDSGDGRYNDYDFSGAPDNAWLQFHYPYSNWSLVLANSTFASGVTFPPSDADQTSPSYFPVFKPVADGGYGVDKSTFFWGLGDTFNKTFNCFQN